MKIAHVIFFNSKKKRVIDFFFLPFSLVIVGRDKVYRTIQYAARFLAWCKFFFCIIKSEAVGFNNLFCFLNKLDCLKKGYNKETVARLSALKSTLGLSRKCKYFFLTSLHYLSLSQLFIRYFSTYPFLSLSSLYYYFSPKLNTCSRIMID